MLKRHLAPVIRDAVEFSIDLKPYTSLHLDNGVPVYMFNAGTEEVLQVELVFFAGNWYEDHNLIASATNFLLRNGTHGKSAYEINEHFDFYGSYLNRNCYSETATLSLHCLNKHPAELFPVMREIITDSIFPREELDIFKQNMKQRLEVNLKKCDFVANRLIDECLYGGQHPYGRYSSTVAYEALQRESLLHFFNRYYRQGKCLIFAAGKLPAGFEQLLNRNFGDLPLNREELPLVNYAVESAAQMKYRIMNDPNGVQGAIRIASHFPNRHHPDFKKAQVLNTLLGGFFGSRLMSNIREDKGYTYGIHSYFQNHVRHSAWMISTEAGREVCEPAIAEIYEEMKRLREEPVPEDELLLVKNYLIGTILGDLDGPFQVISRWKNIILNDLNENYFAESVRAIKTVTPDELNALARKYLKPETFYEMVVV